MGRGLGFGTVQEAALKLKETCGLHAEAFSSAEVRHGPMALIKPGFPVLVFAQDDETRDGIAELTLQSCRRRALVMTGGIKVAGATPLPTLRAHAVLQPILTAQSFLLSCGECARAGTRLRPGPAAAAEQDYRDNVMRQVLRNRTYSSRFPDEERPRGCLGGQPESRM